MTRIHERYLYPFFPNATLILSFLPQFWPPYIILSLINLLNLYNLFWAPPFAPLESILKIPVLGQLFSILNIGTLVYLLRHLKTSTIHRRL
jgi:hypothetical protein